MVSVSMHLTTETTAVGDLWTGQIFPSFAFFCFTLIVLRLLKL